MKDDLRYTPTDCLETFPFPKDHERQPALERTGKGYFEARAALMVRNEQGLTTTYNRFHDPDERLPDVLGLRELHAQMDRAVLDAYGWTDIQPVYDFREQLDESIRLTWAEDTRDEVLARLLALNRVRAEEEAKSGATVEARKPSGTAKKATSTKKGAKKPSSAATATGDLFGEGEK